MGKGGVLEILLGMRRLLLGIPIDYSLLYGELETPAIFVTFDNAATTF